MTARAGDEEPAAVAAERAFAAELRRRLQAIQIIEPEALADLFGLGFAGGLRGRTVCAVLQAELAQRTVEHARLHVPYYRERPDYRVEFGGGPNGEPDLSAVPTIDRATVASNHRDFLAEDVRLRSVCHTSGTTGRPLEICKSHEEVAFLGAFFRRLFAPAYGDAQRTLSLSFPTPHHGVPIPMPTPAIPFVSGVTDDTLIQDALRVLDTTYPVDGAEARITQLSGMGFQILFFTNYLLEQGRNPAEFGLRSINVAGGFMPAHWRRFLADSWGAVVNDRFSLTETVGGATRCHHCGLFRPDAQLLFEAVDVENGRSLDAGIGGLVVTNLYPFAQMMPLIRYRTGDLVRYGQCCTGVRGFAFLGRERNAVAHRAGGRREWLLFSSDLHEILATLPDLNVYEWFANVRVARDRTVGSLPIVALRHQEPTDGRTVIRLEAELRYSPHTHPARAAEVRQSILEGLGRAPETALAARLADGSVSLEVVLLPPGGLRDEYMIKI